MNSTLHIYDDEQNGYLVGNQELKFQCFLNEKLLCFYKDNRLKSEISDCAGLFFMISKYRDKFTLGKSIGTITIPENIPTESFFKDLKKLYNDDTEYNKVGEKVSTKLVPGAQYNVHIIEQKVPKVTSCERWAFIREQSIPLGLYGLLLVYEQCKNKLKPGLYASYDFRELLSDKYGNVYVPHLSIFNNLDLCSFFLRPWYGQSPYYDSASFDVDQNFYALGFTELK